MKKTKLTYEEKVEISLEKNEPNYALLIHEYKVPDNKVKLFFWRIKNYFKTIKNNLISMTIWLFASFGLTTILSYLYINYLEPWLTNHSWTYLNKYREILQPVYPYIFGSDGVAHWYDLYGSEYLYGFDEPWQFIYYRYEWIKEATFGVAEWQRERIAFGIFSIFFSFALISLIGIIVGKIRAHGLKALFVDFVLIPKRVFEYSKRANRKLIDHFLIGTFVAFVSGFVIKNPFAMPLLSLGFLISFSMGQDSNKVFDQYVNDCARKFKDDEQKPLFADSALYIWSLGTGFLLYSILGFYIWKKAKFAFFARFVETLFWLIIIYVIYAIRNGKKTTRLISKGVGVFALAGAYLAISTIKVHATVLEIWYDENGNRIGQLIILDNKPDGSSYTDMLSSMRNGGGGLLGGASASKNSKKPYRIKSDEEKAKEAREKARNEAREKNIPQLDEENKENWDDLNYYQKYLKVRGLKSSLISNAKGNGDFDHDDIRGDENVKKLRDELQHFETKMNINKLSDNDLQTYNNLVDRVNKYVRGDTDYNKVNDWNANPQTPKQQNEKINKEAAGQAAYETAKEVGEGKTPAAKLVRLGSATLTGGASEGGVAVMNAGFNMKEGVDNNRYDNAADALFAEGTRVAVDNAVDSLIPKPKLDMGANSPTTEVVENLIQTAAENYVGDVSGDAQDAITGNGSFGDNAANMVTDSLNELKKLVK